MVEDIGSIFKIEACLICICCLTLEIPPSQGCIEARLWNNFRYRTFL